MDSNNCPPCPALCQERGKAAERPFRNYGPHLGAGDSVRSGASAVLPGPSPIVSTTSRTQTIRSRNGQEAALIDLTARIRVARSKVPEMLTL